VEVRTVIAITPVIARKLDYVHHCVNHVSRNLRVSYVYYVTHTSACLSSHFSVSIFPLVQFCCTLMHI